jgi:IS5 family transposase
VRATARQISFADWELMRQRDQGVRLEPLLEAISGFLDDQQDVIERVRRDLVRGLKQPDSGRHGLTATQVLRSLVLMRLKNRDYRELRERIADGLTLRQFTDFYCATVPKHDAFQRGFIRLTPQTLKAVNDLVVRAAVELGLEDGAKLRVDTTVVQTDIHHPTETHCYGMWSASSPAWSAVWPKRWNYVESRAFSTARARLGAGCTRSSA